MDVPCKKKAGSLGVTGTGGVKGCSASIAHAGVYGIVGAGPTASMGTDPPCITLHDHHVHLCLIECMKEKLFIGLTAVHTMEIP
jgi:hypothetical protein